MDDYLNSMMQADASGYMVPSADASGNFFQSAGSSPASAAAPAGMVSSPVAASAPSYMDSLSANKQATLDKLSNIIASGGTLSANQEAKLGKIGGLAGLDFASQLGYTPTSDRYQTKFDKFYSPAVSSFSQPPAPTTTASLSRPEATYPAPINTTNLPSSGTYHRPFESDDFDFTGGHTNAPEFNIQNYADVLSGNKLNKLNSLIDIISSGGTLSKSQEASLGKIGGLANLDVAAQLGYTPVSDKYNTKFSQFAPQAEAVQAQIPGALTTTAAPVTPSWTASPGDLYQNLNPQQEERLSRLAGKYSSGELEGREGKISKLESLLNKGGLGTLESYFAPTSTYTNPADLSVNLPQNVTYQQIADVFRGDDPLKAYALANTLGLTPEQVAQIAGGYQPTYNTPIKTQYDIQNMLTSGKSAATDIGIARAYLENPNDQRFIDNPALVNRAENVIQSYKNPITTPVSATAKDKNGNEIAGTGQYGYINGAPILNTAIIDQMIGDVNRIGGKSFKKNEDIFDELGWNFQSKEGLNKIQRGVDIVGLDSRAYTPNALRSMDYVDPATGDISGGRYELDAAAQKIGIDPSKFDTALGLYQAIEQATDGMYRITGQFGQWDPEQAATPEGKQNHASVLYKDFNGQLMPVSDPQFFKYTRPEDPIIGGKIGEMVASIPFLPEIGAAISGGNPAVYMALKGMQAAAQSGDIGDVAKAVGMAYVTSQFIPKTLSPMISTEIAQMSAVGELAQFSPDLANFVVKSGTNAIIAMGMAELTGQDPVDAAVSALIASGAFKATSTGIDMTNIPNQYKPLISKMFADLLTSKDKQGALTNNAMNYLKTQYNKASQDATKNASSGQEVTV